MQWAWVQVGGGPTGVELAAEMHDYIKEDLSVHFPSLKVCSSPVLSTIYTVLGCCLYMNTAFSLPADQLPQLY